LCCSLGQVVIAVGVKGCVVLCACVCTSELVPNIHVALAIFQLCVTGGFGILQLRGVSLVL